VPESGAVKLQTVKAGIVKEKLGQIIVGMQELCISRKLKVRSETAGRKAAGNS
jgi:hypothetical protein